MGVQPAARCKSILRSFNADRLGAEVWTGTGQLQCSHVHCAYNFVPGRFTFQLNGAQWIPAGSSGGYNPSAYFTPHDVHSFGEIQDAADQMPGGNNNRTGHYGAHLYYNGVWQEGWLTTRNGGFNLMVDPPGGNLGYYNGQQFYIWDGYCST